MEMGMVLWELTSMVGALVPSQRRSWELLRVLSLFDFRLRIFDLWTLGQ